MQTFYISIILGLAYLIGSIPIGLIIVKLVSGQDLRTIQSGRTGSTNAMRAAGIWVGLATAFFDILKGASGVWIAKALLPGNHWLEILAPITVIIGHNYSLFLINKHENGKLHLGGGAGGAPAAGGAMALWPYSLFVSVPLGLLFLFGIGYASLATMSVPVIAIIIFAIRASLGLSPWVYVFYGILAEILLLYSLRPNIKRLLNGTERLVGWRAKRRSHSKPIPNNSG